MTEPGVHGKISSCLWFDHQAKEAAQFYTSLFKNSKMGPISHYGPAGAKVSGQKEGSVMTVSFELEGLQITGLNGGPLFKFTPALSFFVWCESETQIQELWKKLSAGGQARMGLDKYPWAEKYGWTADRFGVEWQMMLSERKPKVAPAFLFVDKLFGRGEEAIQFYMSLFKNSKIESMARDEETKTIKHCVFSLAGTEFAFMEGPGQHGFTFSPAFSLEIHCRSQEEIDHYWTQLSSGGEPGQCGWLTDKFGVSWQVAPAILQEMMLNKDSERVERVMTAMLQMKKMDIKKLQAAYG